MGTKSCIVLLAALTLQAQEPVGMPLSRGVYFRGASGWLALPVNPLMPFADGTARWLLGFGRGHGTAEMAGPHSQIQTPAGRPVFYLRGIDRARGIYLVRQIEHSDSRVLRMPLSGNYQEFAHFRAQDLIPVDLKPDAAGVVSLTPREDLKTGEYAIVSAIDSQSRGLRFSFDFGVGY